MNDTTSLARIPNELRLPILQHLLATTEPTAYAYDPAVSHALRSLTHTDRTWRVLALPFYYSRAVVRRAEDILTLLACPEGLSHIRSLALLRGKTDWSTGGDEESLGEAAHSYCAKELAPLFLALGPTLKRLLVVHDLTRRVRDCYFHPGSLSAFEVLEELVVDSPCFLMPFSLLRWYSRGLQNWVTALPPLPRLKRLATSRDRTWWREFQYSSLFPELEELVFCERQGGQTDERDVLAMREQMLAPGAGWKLEIVEDRMVYESRVGEWEAFERHFLPARVEVRLVEEPERWFLRRALKGGLFGPYHEERG